jgi:hypothetical protein
LFASDSLAGASLGAAAAVPAPAAALAVERRIPVAKESERAKERKSD